MISDDILRWLSIGEGAVLVILVFMVMLWYLSSPTRRKETTIHVLLISVSYLSAIVFIAYSTYLRIGLQVTWTTPLGIFTESMGVAALLALLLKYLSNGRDNSE